MEKKKVREEIIKKRKNLSSEIKKEKKSKILNPLPSSPKIDSCTNPFKFRGEVLRENLDTVVEYLRGHANIHLHAKPFTVLEVPSE